MSRQSSSQPRSSSTSPEGPARDHRLCLAVTPSRSGPGCRAGSSILADLDAMSPGGPLDAVLDGLDLLLAVLGGVVRVVDVAPCRADLLGGVDRVLVVGRVGELDVAVLMLAPRGVHVVSSFKPLGHHSLPSGLSVITSVWGPSLP